MAMIQSVKDILIIKMDEFLKEVDTLSDGEFIVGKDTSLYFADAVEVIWNSMGYSAELEAED